MTGELLSAFVKYKFSNQLIKIIDKLCNEGCDVKIKYQYLNLSPDPEAGNVLNISVTYKNSITRTYVMSAYIMLSDADWEILCNRISEKMQEDFYTLGMFSPLVKSDISKTFDVNSYDNDDNFIKAITNELNTRGDFKVDISKLVDVLFKLGVVVPKEEENKGEEL